MTFSKTWPPKAFFIFSWKLSVLCIAASKNGYDTCPVKTVAAGEIEGAVMEQLRAVFRSPELVAETCRAARVQRKAEIARIESERRGLREQAETETAPSARVRIEDRITAADRVLAGLRECVVEEPGIADALRELDPLWDELFPAEQARIVRLLVERVIVNDTGIQVRFRPEGLSVLAAELNEQEECVHD